jgi:hypothetical protein
VALLRAEVAAARKDPRRALEVLEPLAREKTTAPEAVLMQIARSAQEAGDRDKAIAHYRRVYFEFPLSAESDLAKIELDLLEGPPTLTGDRFALELARAERVFGARKYEQARDAFVALSGAASGDDRELVALRIAECDYFLKRYRVSLDALRPYLEGAKRQAEARFFHLTATRALGDLETYVPLASGLINDFPEESWTEETRKRGCGSRPHLSRIVSTVSAGAACRARGLEDRLVGLQEWQPRRSNRCLRRRRSGDAARRHASRVALLGGAVA